MKASKHDAEYEERSTHNGEFCAGCAHFESPRTCEKVEGIINPRGWCKWWEMK
jgi:hypothetical protein